MDNPIDKIQSYYEDLTKTDKEIAIYAMNNPRDVATQPLEYLAKVTGSSKSALSRFAQRIGYAGFTEFKFDIARFLVSHNDEKEVGNEDPITRITRTYSDYILKMGESLDPKQIDRIAEVIPNSRNVKIIGFNRSANSANQLKQRLIRIGYSNISSEDDSAVISDILSSGSDDDVYVIFTTTDNTRFFSSHLKDNKDKKYKIICITCNPSLPFKKQCYEYIAIPRISRDSYASFLDDQALFLIFIEVLIEAIVRKTK